MARATPDSSKKRNDPTGKPWAFSYAREAAQRVSDQRKHPTGKPWAFPSGPADSLCSRVRAQRGVVPPRLRSSRPSSRGAPALDREASPGGGQVTLHSDSAPIRRLGARHYATCLRGNRNLGKRRCQPIIIPSGKRVRHAVRLKNGRYSAIACTAINPHRTTSRTRDDQEIVIVAALVAERNRSVDMT